MLSCGYSSPGGGHLTTVAVAALSSASAVHEYIGFRNGKRRFDESAQ